MATLTMGAVPDNVLTNPPAGLDTLDEVDYFAMKDTIKLSRRNLAKDNPKLIDIRKYVVKDVYVPNHQTFDKHWYDHIYVGAGIGAEQIVSRFDDFKYRTMTSLNIHVGKQISKYSDVRLSFVGGWGYQNDTEACLIQGGIRADYMYSISTLLNGYNPARRMDVSLLVGLGGMYSKATGVDGKIVPEGHIGVHLKCYTGPLGTINIEPYVGMAADQLDLSGTRNYHKYDMFYGIRCNYSYYFDNNLSKEARLKILQNRLADDRMVDPYTLESWRTPWFFEYAVGPAIVSSDDEGISNKMGSQVSISAGKWLSPVMGFRVTGATKTYRWKENYSGYYYNAGIDALLNPLGFLRNFRWRSQWGGFLSFGVGFGQRKEYQSSLVASSEQISTIKETTHTTSDQVYRLGLHFYGRLSEDLQLFVEPYYAFDVYTMADQNTNRDKLYTDNSFGVNIGMTMLIKSHRFRDLYEMDNTQDYTYKNVRGFRVGVAGGFPVIQTTGITQANGGMNWNAMAFVEYRFNRLHSVRLQGELMNLNLAYTETYLDSYLDENYRIVSTTKTRLEKTKNKLFLGSLNYMVNLTNLCSGRFIDRKVELDGFIGPALGAMSSKSMYGFDLGLQLRARVWNNLSVVIVPTSYIMNFSGKIDGLKTINIGGFRYFHTINFGVMYKIGSMKMSADMKRRKVAHDAEMWRLKQIEKEKKWQLKQEQKEKKRREKLGY